MDVLSTLEVWKRVAQIPDDHEREAAWVETYEASFPSVFEVYYSAWGDEGRRREAASHAPGLISRVHDAELRARSLVRKAEEDFLRRGLLSQEAHAVLMVGGHTSNGWVAEHAGRRSLFLALEFLGLPPYDDLLVVHELTHVAQAEASVATRARTFPASLAVVVEGVATATSRVLRPGLSDSAYLWMDDDHQAWAQECQANATRIASVLARHLDTPDDAPEVAGLFRNRTDGLIPPRSAYWVGDSIAREMLQEGHAVGDLLKIGPEEARARVARWAEAAIARSD